MIQREDLAVQPTNSYFPLEIVYTETSEKKVVSDPSEILDGKTFKVLRTRVAIIDQPK